MRTFSYAEGTKFEIPSDTKPPLNQPQKRERRRNSRYNSAEFESYQTSDEKELENSESSDTKKRRSSSKFEQ